MSESVLSTRLWDIAIFGNYFDGHAYNYGARRFVPIMADSEDEAVAIMEKHIDVVKGYMMGLKTRSGRWFVLRRNPSLGKVGMIYNPSGVISGRYMDKHGILHKFNAVTKEYLLQEAIDV